MIEVIDDSRSLCRVGQGTGGFSTGLAVILTTENDARCTDICYSYKSDLSIAFRTISWAGMAIEFL